MLFNQKQLVGKLNAVNEYEREPVPAGQLKGWKSFLGMYAGEHTAGTEFVIGPLFVAHGVTAPALVVGLLVGNVLATLSWALLCAPVAVKNRITLYYQLEKICGPRLTTVYNLVNALMFCFLAGSMIAVSATAVGIPFDLAMPSLNDVYPNSVGWVLTVVVVGAITTVVAMLGYDQVSKFANVAAPWMVMVFIAAAVAVLPDLGVHSLSDFWTVAQTKIWTGVPLEGQSQFTVWHVIFFSWFCNMAMHIGMADMFDPALRQEMAVRLHLSGRNVRGALRGLDCLGYSLLLVLTRVEQQSELCSRASGLPCRGRRRSHLRRDCRVDHRQPYHLPRWAGGAVHHAPL